MIKTNIQRIQDNVHGLMEFCGTETLLVELLQTQEIQRLRRIKQLGLVNLIFPGAEHSRFTHSLGAAYLSLKFIKQVKEEATNRLADIFVPTVDSMNDLAIATLCHDLGHGPLSHAWEREIIGTAYKAKKKEWAKEFGLNISDLPPDIKWHEMVTLGLLSWKDGELHKFLEDHSIGLSKRIQLVLMGKHYIPYLPKLIKSDIDVDRSDFIRRDALMTGVAYGRYDIEWLTSTCTFGFHTVNGKEHLVVGFDRRKSIRVIEQFLIARGALYDTVYHHKTVVSAEGMIKKLFTRLKDYIEEKKFTEKDIEDNFEKFETVKMLVKLIKGEVIGLQEIIRFDDNVIWTLIEQIAFIDKLKEDRALEDLSRRILSRDLFKVIPVSEKQIENYITKKKGYSNIYKIIEKYMPEYSNYYLIIEDVSYSVISESDEDQSFLIDVENNRKAVPLKDVEEFNPYRNKVVKNKRIFTIYEAVSEIVKEIEDNQE